MMQNKTTAMYQYKSEQYSNRGPLFLPSDMSATSVGPYSSEVLSARWSDKIYVVKNCMYKKENPNFVVLLEPINPHLRFWVKLARAPVPDLICDLEHTIDVHPELLHLRREKDCRSGSILHCQVRKHTKE